LPLRNVLRFRFNTTLGSAGVSGKYNAFDVEGGVPLGFVTVTKSVAGEATTAFVK
jgi:hypothetical protein